MNSSMALVNVTLCVDRISFIIRKMQGGAAKIQFLLR